jgi:hypothetical protein
MPIEIGTLVAIVGMFIGLAGWLTGRDKRLFNDGQWKGEVSTKLDTLIKGNEQIPTILTMMSGHEARLNTLEKKGDSK